MKIQLKQKDGTIIELSKEDALKLLEAKKAKIEPLKCKTQMVEEDGKKVLNIFAPSLGKLLEAKEPNK